MIGMWLITDFSSSSKCKNSINFDADKEDDVTKFLINYFLSLMYNNLNGYLK